MEYKYSRGNEDLGRRRVAETLSSIDIGKNLKRLATLGTVAAALTCYNICGIGHLDKEVVYQGYTIDHGVDHLVFDDEGPEYRIGSPDLVAEGDPSGLVKGVAYDVTHNDPRLFGDKYITSIKPSR